MATYKGYPYPVLKNGDDLYGEFSFSLDYLLDQKEITLECDFSLRHGTIEDLISRGEAVFLAEVMCPTTFFRESISSGTGRWATKLNAEDVRAVVKVSGFVCAVREIADYYPTGIHPDLAGDPFRVEAGDVLAIGGTASFVAEKDFDPLRAPVSSFLKVQRGSFKRGPMLVDYSDDARIVIELSEDDHDMYGRIRPFAAANLHASVVLPVLTDALHLISKGSTDFQDRPWCVKIQQICAGRNLDPSDSLDTAQKLLAEPVTRSFKNIQDLWEIE